MISKEKFEEVKRVGFKSLDYAHRNFSEMDEEQYHEIDAALDIGVEKWAERFPSEIRAVAARLMEELIDEETDSVPVCTALAELIEPFISFPEIEFGKGRATLMYSVCDGGGMGYEEFCQETNSCSRCDSTNLATFSGRCKDMFGIDFQTQVLPNGEKTYEGYPIILGSGDDMEVTLCLECGQVQGFDKFPIQPADWFDTE